MARFREAERPALFRPVDFLPLDFRALDFRPLDREDFRAELPPPRFADLLDFLADRPALFLAPFRADFLLPLFADRFADFLCAPPPDLVVPPVRLLGDGSSKSKVIPMTRIHEHIKHSVYCSRSDIKHIS